MLRLGSLRLGRRKTVACDLLFEPRDLWVGVYWKHERPGGYIVESWNIYICVVPMLPLRVSVDRLAL